jgi:hypothetical protein
LKRLCLYTFSQRPGLAFVLEFITSSPELQPNKITDDEVKNKSTIELRLAEPMLLANKKMRNYSSACMAANPMLYAAVPLLSALSYC